MYQFNGLPTLVAGVLKDPSSSDVWKAGIPEFMNFGNLVPTALHVKFTLQREYMSELESWGSFCPIILLKMGVGSPFLVKYPLVEVWNIGAFLTFTGPVGPFGLSISWLPVLFGETVAPPPTRNG